ncbi:MAG: hypothetical protein M1122_01245 [Candidatus Marsarchaeota archaeon]|nr:hypothetical protein [Candidatus Marsarchaeota archaeon]
MKTELCHICGRIAHRTCKMCGRPVCDKDMDLKTGLCNVCSSGKKAVVKS